MLQYRIFWWQLFVVCASLIKAIQEDAVGKHDWYNMSIGDVFQAHFDSRNIYLASRQNLLAAANPADIRDIKWRKVFEQTDQGTIQAVHFCSDLIWVVFARRPHCLGFDYASGSVRQEVHISGASALKDSVSINDALYVLTSDDEVIAVEDGDIVWRFALKQQSQWTLGSEVALFAVASTGYTRLSLEGHEESTERFGTEVSRCVPDLKHRFLYCTYRNNGKIKFYTNGERLNPANDSFESVDGVWRCNGDECTHEAATATYLRVLYKSKVWKLPYAEEKELYVGNNVRFAHSDGHRAVVITEDLEAYCYVNGRLTSRSDQSLVAVDRLLISPPVVVLATSSGVIVGARLSDGEQLWRIGNLGSRPVILDRCSGRKELFSLWRDGSGGMKALTFDPANGKIFDSCAFPGGDFHFSKDACSVWREHDGKYDLVWKNSSGEHDSLVVKRKGSNLLECQLTSGKSLWSLQVGSDTARIVQVAIKEDLTARTNWVILPDRSVIHKQLDADIFAVLSYSEQTRCLFLYLIKAKTGQVLYANAHRNVRSPFFITAVENSIVYSYQTPQSELDFGARTELTTVSLFREHKPTVDKMLVPFPLQGLGVSVTERGITGRSLLLATSAGHVYEVNWDFSPIHYRKRAANELLVHPSDQAIVNYYHLVRYCRHVSSAPHSQSESRSYIVAYGLDLFSAVIQPSRSFDTLKDDVNKKFISVLICALLLAAWGTRYWAKRCALENAWK